MRLINHIFSILFLTVSLSCSSTIDFYSFPKRSISSIGGAGCDDLIFEFIAGDLAKKYKKELDGFKELVEGEFEIPKEMGTWRFRSKKQASLERKLRKIKIGEKILYGLESTAQSLQSRSLKPVQKLGDALHKVVMTLSKIIVPDGIAGRLILNDTSVEGMEVFTEKLVRAIKNNQLKIMGIRNYQLKNGYAYLSPEMMGKITEATKSVKRPIKIFDEKAATKEMAYSSIHIISFVKGVGLTEIQVRGPTLDKLAESLHLFYDTQMGKSLDNKFFENPAIVNLYKKMEGMTENQVSEYLKYVNDFYVYVRQVEVGENAVAPKLPESLKNDPELNLENVWKLLKQYYPEDLRNTSFEKVFSFLLQFNKLKHNKNLA